MPTTGRVADAILTDELDIPADADLAVAMNRVRTAIDWGILPTARIINNEFAQAAPMPWDRVPPPQPARVRNEFRNSAGVYGEDYS